MPDGSEGRGLSKEQYEAKLRELGSPEKIREWLEEVAPNLSLAEASTLDQALKDMVLGASQEQADMGPPNPFDPDPESPERTAMSEVSDLANAREIVSNRVVELQPQGEGEDVTGDGEVTEEDQELAEEAQFGEVDEDLQRYDWIYQALGVTNDEALAMAAQGQSALDTALTEEDKQQILDWMAVFYGQQFSTFEDLVASGYLDQRTRENELLINAAVRDEEPQQAFEIDVPGYKTQFVRQRDLAGAQAFGADAKQISTYMKLAALSNMVGGDGESLVWQPLMMLSKASGLHERLDREAAAIAKRAEAAKDDAASEDAFDVVQDVLRRTAEEASKGQGVILDLNRDGIHDPFEAWIPKDEAPDDQMSGPLPYDVIADSETASRDAANLSIRQLGERFNEGIGKYADAGLAFIYAVEPDLAQRMAWAYENDGKVTDADQAAAARVIAKMGFNDPLELGEALVSAGYVEANTFKFFGRGGDMFNIDDLLEASRGAERVITMPDPEAVRQNVKSLYQQLFLDDPTEEQISQFAGQVTNIMVGNQQNEDVNQATDELAQLQGIFENTDLYEQLYRNKPGGLSELDYQNVFRVGAQSMLGAEATLDPDAIRQGMQTGDIQTTIGALMGDEESFENSTFTGRLARIAQSVAGMT